MVCDAAAAGRVMSVMCASEALLPAAAVRSASGDTALSFDACSGSISAGLFPPRFARRSGRGRRLRFGRARQPGHPRLDDVEIEWAAPNWYMYVPQAAVPSRASSVSTSGPRPRAGRRGASGMGVRSMMKGISREIGAWVAFLGGTFSVANEFSASATSGERSGRSYMNFKSLPGLIRVLPLRNPCQ